MPVTISLLPDQQLSALNAAYRQAVVRKRLRYAIAAAATASDGLEASPAAAAAAAATDGTENLNLKTARGLLITDPGLAGVAAAAAAAHRPPMNHPKTEALIAASKAMAARATATVFTNDSQLHGAHTELGRY